MWYRYKQNNSGGSFHIDDIAGIGPVVFIAANDTNEADNKAEEIGIYFDGVEQELDCDCCGDRWSRAVEYIDGFMEVDIYPSYDFYWHDTVYLHDLDGCIERIKNAE